MLSTEVEAMVERRVALRVRLIDRLAIPNKYTRALDEIHGLLVDLQRQLGESIGSADNAWLLRRAIDACCYHDPKFNSTFDQGRER